MVDFSLHCPAPEFPGQRIQLAHGSGGRAMHQLLHQVFLPALSPSGKAAEHDGAILEWKDSQLAFSTDSYVVRPLFFPGGDIGSLAVFGTVNDLAMCGARALGLSAGFILEEGFPVEDLKRILASMKQALQICKVPLVTGDTKVVERGKGDGLYVNTAGIGVREHPGVWNPLQVKAGDRIILSGDLGRHGMAILSVREGLAFETEVTSDLAPLWEPVQSILDSNLQAHCLRDLTRGGLSSALNEIAQASGLSIRLEESLVPVCEEVAAACEMLGYSPFHVACEGRFIAIAPPDQAEKMVETLQKHSISRQATVIGEVRPGQRGQVTLRNRIGVDRILDMLSGEQLPRIC